MSMKKFALIALASTALAVPAYASTAEIDQLTKEINALKAKVNELSKKASAAPAAAPSSGPTFNYVKTCEAQGDGFFIIPGTTSCLRLSGYARAEGTYSQLKGKDALADAGDKSEIAAAGRMRLNTDFRSSTDMGTLRGFLRMHLNMGSGSARSVKSDGTGDANAVTSFSTTADLAYAYVSLGGFSAGRQDSAFLFYNAADAAFIPSDDGVAPIAASYTATLASGLTATLSVENPLQRSVVKNTFLGNPTRPELVGAIQSVSGPLTLKLAGASHQVVDEDTSTTKQGYAAQGGAKYVLSPDTTLWLQGTYAKGAMSYLGYGIAGKWGDIDASNEGNNVAVTTVSGDASVDGNLTLSSGWSALAGVNQVVGKGNLALVGTYGSQKNYGSVGDAGAVGVKGNVMQIEANYTFKPYAGFNLQPAIAYQKWELSNIDTGDKSPANTDRYSVRLRAWREF